MDEQHSVQWQIALLFTFLDAPVALLILFVMPVVLILCALFADPGQARCELRGWKKTRAAVETADMFILSWLVQPR